MNDTFKILSALCDPTRLAALRLLSDKKEHCVCELTDTTGTTQSRMSRHMLYLKQAGLVTARREAPWTYYKMVRGLKPNVAALIRAALQLETTN